MSNATIGALRIVLGLDAANFETGLTAAKKQLRDSGKQMQAVGQTMMGVGAGLTAAITAPFIAAGFHLLKGSQDAAAAAAQVNAALDSMGGASGKTAEELTKSAEALRNLTGVDDDEILKKVTANMLTFGNIAGDTFDRAQMAVLNLSARMEGDLQGATMMIGKALNDPVKGLAALGRAGIQFTDQQKAQIKAMVGVGNAAGAQAIMLGELEKQFGGAAKAAADADVWTPMKIALMELEGAFEPIVRNVLAPAIAKIAELTTAFANLSPSVQGLVVAGAAIAAALGPALIAFGAITTAVGSLTVAFATGGLLAGIVPLLGPIGLAVAGVAAAFMLFKDDIIPVLQSFGASLQEHVGPKIAPLFEALRGVVDQLGKAFAAFFSSDGGSAAENLKDFGRMVAQVFGAAVDLITGAVNTITQIMRAVGAALNGDWSTMWNALGSAVAALTHGVLNAFRTLFPGVLGAVKSMYEGVRDWLGNKLAEVFGGVIRRIKQVGDAFHDLYIRVVGNSDVPDMVTEVGEWMNKLQQTLVDPAEKATKAAGDHFERLRDRARAAMSDLLSERERLDLDYAQKRLDLAGERDLVLRAEFERRAERQYREASAGLDAAGLENRPVTQVIELDADGSISRLNKSIEDANKAIRDAREGFAESFSYGIESALRGDWRGLLESIVGSTFEDALRDVGRMLFDGFGGGKKGGKGAGLNLMDIGSSIASIFSKLPKFANGGTIRAGGSGGIDSQLVAFWKSPSEQVDVFDPRFAGSAPGGVTFDLRGAVMTQDLLRQMNEIGTVHGDRAYSRAMTAAPQLTMSQTAQQRQHAVGRRTR